MATLAAGGFSPNALSVAGYNNPAAEWIIIVFMFISGASFALHYRTMYVNRTSLIGDPEFRFYSLLVGVAILVVVLIGGVDGSFLGDSPVPWHSCSPRALPAVAQRRGRGSYCLLAPPAGTTRSERRSSRAWLRPSEASRLVKFRLAWTVF